MDPKKLPDEFTLKAQIDPSGGGWWRMTSPEIPEMITTWPDLDSAMEAVPDALRSLGYTF